MKKIAFTGIILFLVMFLWTCDAGLPDDVVDFTDVEYSEDGSFVTVYLDGSKPVPVTRAQRAMSKELAKMAYDYLEVIFVNDRTAAGKGTVARAAWELGQSAGISGVDRGKTSAGVDYLWAAGKDGDTGSAAALMFVGRKDDKTLLGIGRILQVDHLPAMKKPIVFATGDGLPVPASITGAGPFAGPYTYNATITEDSKSVTFWIEAVKTGLLIGKEVFESVAADETKDPGVAFPSISNFKGDFPDPDNPGDKMTVDIKAKSKRTSLPDSKLRFPKYDLPEETGEVSTLTYTFGGGAKTFASHIILEDEVAVERRFPRYLVSGSYRQPKSNIDTTSTVKLDGYTAGPGDAFNNAIPLEITSLGYGIFSFYIEAPVYMFIDDDATNGSLKPIIWKIRTGLGPELYSLDDGLGSGGCVLLAIDVGDLDWLDIEWGWVR